MNTPPCFVSSPGSTGRYGVCYTSTVPRDLRLLSPSTSKICVHTGNGYPYGTHASRTNTQHVGNATRPFGTEGGPLENCTRNAITLQWTSMLPGIRSTGIQLSQASQVLHVGIIGRLRLQRQPLKSTAKVVPLTLPVAGWSGAGSIASPEGGTGFELSGRVHEYRGTFSKVRATL